MGLPAVHAGMPQQVFEDPQPGEQPNLPLVGPARLPVPGTREPVPHGRTSATVTLETVTPRPVLLEIGHTPGNLATGTELPRGRHGGDERRS